MIPVELARRLRESGLRWHPAAGDRFAIPQPALEDQVFTLSEMVIEPRHHSTGTVLAFNGTTEWALDSVEAEDALWLPREDQLRDMLGGTFVSLDRADGLWRVTSRVPGAGERTDTGPTAAEAYAHAVLELLRVVREPVSS